MKGVLRGVPTLMLVLVGATSFLLSYVAIRDVSVRLAAVPEYLAWAVPVTIDGGILAGSAAIWASSYQRKKRDPLAFLTVATLLATSVVVNVSHAGPAPLAKWIAALPPLILLATLEIVAASHRTQVAEQDTAPAVAPEPAPMPAPVPAPTAAAAPQPRPVPAATPALAPAATTPAAPIRPAPAPIPAPVPAAVARTERAAETPAPVAPARVQAPTRPVAGPPAARSAAAAPAEPAAAPSDAPGRRPLRVQAAAPAVPVPDEVDGVPATAAGNQVVALFNSHVTGGGDPADRTIAGRIAEQTGLSTQYVRRVLKPLRDQALAAT